MKTVSAVASFECEQMYISSYTVRNAQLCVHYIRIYYVSLAPKSSSFRTTNSTFSSHNAVCR